MSRLFLRNVRYPLMSMRLYGASITGAAVLLGAFMAKPDTPWYMILMLIALATMWHASMGIFNELCHRGEDKSDPTQHPDYNASMKARETRMFFIKVLLLTMFTLSLICLGLFPTILLLASQALALYYSRYGKYQSYLYDQVPAVGFALLVLFGASAVSDPNQKSLFPSTA